MVHDFKGFPELTNSQLGLYYFQSPHKQITEDFTAKVVRVNDGDTITVDWEDRDFTFPIRLADIDTKELNEGGDPARRYLEKLVNGKEILVLIDPQNRVEKWGRIIGRIISLGVDINDEMINSGHATRFEDREQPLFPSFEFLMEEK